MVMLPRTRGRCLDVPLQFPPLGRMLRSTTVSASFLLVLPLVLFPFSFSLLYWTDLNFFFLVWDYLRVIVTKLTPASEAQAKI